MRPGARPPKWLLAAITMLAAIAFVVFALTQAGGWLGAVAE